MKIGDKVKIGVIDNTWSGYVDELEKYVNIVGRVTEIGEKSDWFVFDDDDSYVFPISCAILQPWDKQDFLNTKIAVTPEQSEKLQRYLFSLECTWESGDTDLKHTDKPYLYVSTLFKLSCSLEEDTMFFDRIKSALIKFEDIIFNEKFEKEYLFVEALKDKVVTWHEIEGKLVEDKVVENKFINQAEDLAKQTIESQFDKLYNEYKVEVGGFKDIKGKMYYELDWQFVQDLAERMFENKVENGGKYERDNWKKTLSAQELENSIDRHYMKMKLGQTDEDHEIAIVANLMMLRYLKRNK